jgi:type I site-specific restriction endonuclease/ribosome-binding protein aMBF1 (putative translation factor)
MKEPRVQELPPLQLKPIISYPRIAEAGEQYLLSIDVQLADGSPWPYQEEEFEISFVLETDPFFTHEPLGEQEPGIVLHRFGGTYGPAEYLLTAAHHPVAPGTIKLALLNGWGLPIAQLKLDCEVKRHIQAHVKQPKIERRKIALTPKSLPPSLTPFPLGFSRAMIREIHDNQLKSGNWGKQFASDIQLNMPAENGQQVTHRYTLLRLAPSLPIALVYKANIAETLITFHNHIANAAVCVAVPFAYILMEDRVVEYDYTGDLAGHTIVRSQLPERAVLQQRWLTSLQLTDTKAIDALTYPYHTNQFPRYYQEAAINQAVIGTLRAIRGLRNRRILLTLATGTGKTLIAFQIIWKLKQTRQVRNILFLADRSYLLDQAQFNTFGPFQEAITRGIGQIDTAHDIVFATYQWLAGTPDDRARYKNYPSDYFDMIIVDECHRSSASENSEWRRILEYFSHAVQIGLTATPLDTRDVQTDRYYGPSVYTYSLSQGIQDGYLAPYRVHRVLIEQALSIEEVANELYLRELLAATKPVSILDQDVVVQAGNIMQMYTQTIAQHLASYLQRTDTRAKTIVFCVNNAHADQMRIELERACASWIRSGDIVRIVDDDGAEGRRTLNLFCTPREPQPVIVTTSRLLTTGVDVPTCKNIVLARGVGSIVEFKQIIGRGTRLFPPEKTWFTIIDYAGAIKHFFDPAFDGAPQLVESETIVPSNRAEYFTNSSHSTSLGSETDIESDTDRLGELDDTKISPVRHSASKPNLLLRKEREQRGWTQEELAEKIGVNPITVKRWESGSSLPNVFYRQRLSEVFGKTLDELGLLGDETEIVTNTNPIDTGVSSRKPNHLLRNARIQRGWTQEELAEKIGVNPITVKRWEGDYSTPSPRYRRALSELFEKSLDELGLPGVSPQPSGQTEVSKTDTIHIISEEESGNQFAVINEEFYELAPDGRTLRKVSNDEFSRLKLQGIAATPQELKELWIVKEDRQEVLEGREDLLRNLLEAYELKNVDEFDLLLYLLFQIPMITRETRVGRLRTEHADFFQRFENNSLANQVINMILDKYVNGDIVDVNDVGLLRIPPLSTLGTSMELAKAFREEPGAEKPDAQTPASKNSISTALKELQDLLYQVL